MFWMLPLLGAGVGAVMNKNNPLQGALLGGALGATGGLLAPAAAGAGAAGAAATGASALPAAAGSYGAEAFGTAAGYGGVNAPFAGLSSPTTGGLLSGMKEAAAYAKPIGQSLSAANAAKGLLTNPADSMPIQTPQNNSAQGAQILAQLAQQQPSMTPEQQFRMQRRKTMWG
jgi:hypothetical protein